MKKILSIVGARPNFMKIAPIHRAFEKYSDAAIHKIVHTGQHYDREMSDAFFVDLELPKPAYYLGVGSASHAQQTAKIMIEFEKVLELEKPDLVIVVGDVNSTIACCLTAVKLGIKVAHIEGGLRSFDRDMPEEVNRVATDSICNFCFITEQSAIDNLVKENFPKDNIFFVGNTMIDSLLFTKPKAEKSNILETLELKEEQFILATIHRPSNVDNYEQLSMLIDIFENISKKYEIVFPIHPRTLSNIEKLRLKDRLGSIKGLKITKPLGYIDFLALMMKCKFVMTDSGGIQEETTKLLKPCLTLRTTTERPSTVDLGTNILVQPNRKEIDKHSNDFLNGKFPNGKIPELWDGKAAERIVDIIMNKLLH